MTDKLPTVFHDPTGKRARRLARLIALLGLAGAVLATLFALSLFAAPLLPEIGALSSLRHQVKPVAIHIPNHTARLQRYLLRQSRERLWQQIVRTEKRIAKKPHGAGAHVRGAFYATWQETGLESLRANADRLTHLFPEWLRLDAQGAAFDARDFDLARVPHNVEVLRVAKEHQLQILPMLSNSDESRGGFDPVRVHRLLGSADKQEALAHALAAFLVENDLSGLNLDFENLEADDYRKLNAFVELLAHRLHEKKLILSIDVEADNRFVSLDALQKHADLVVLMAYDEHWAGGEPGPIAPLPWFTRAVEAALAHVPPDKLVVGIGNYAYDWPKDKRGAQAESLSCEQAVLRARTERPDDPPAEVITFDAAALNAGFRYRDDDSAEHVVWMLDAASAYDEWKAMEKLGVRGAALWVLGSEDPGLWSFFDRTPRELALEKIDAPAEIEYEGKGEILALSSTPSEGRRKVETDPKTGLITDEVYTSFPSGYVIRRSGHRSDTVALTFDDGPDPKYTPLVLDTLKIAGIHASFFVIGEAAERYPSLIERIYQEGHDIGSHTFTHPNLAAVSPEREILELNATQRALESVLGRSTILFRPPYAADAEPRSADEVRPIALAASRGYLTVGELVDPQDWRIEGGRTSDDIASEILAETLKGEANIVLLHDGGGDRSRTVEALRTIIPKLRASKKMFATVSDLLQKPREEVMPTVESREALLVGVDRIVFEIIYVVETVLFYAFFSAIILGIGRVLILLPLALVGRVREKRRRFGPSAPSVSVLIAAYNEQPVIARTIESIKKSDREVEQIIVVDDGSKDGTAEEVERRFAGDPRVAVVRQANAGKAAALNRAIEAAKGEVLVCLDADTQLAPEAIRLLARRFEDPRVGAVAGNVKVGNRVNVFTRWQAIEYVISQNLDRRAQAVLNAVTVVPGAVGAWRKSAVERAGGYLVDTLAEDMDLTFRLRRAGWTIDTETEARGYTEAPEDLRAFFKQRFRWSYGTLQCLFKHRRALFRHGWFGRFALPSMWLFQFAFQLLAPLVDLQLLYAVGRFAIVWITQGVLRQDWQPLPGAAETLMQTAFFYALFFVVELFGAILAFRLDRERLRLLVWFFWQRFGYRQLMYAVGIKAVVRAFHGLRQGWGKLERKGTVELPPSSG